MEGNKRMRTFKQFQKETIATHDCDKCHNKLFCIEMDNCGNTHCAYCHEIVNYPKASKEELEAWMKEALK